MFGRKKKSLFGGGIEPSCAHCRHNGGTGGATVCSLRLEMKKGKCKKYRYDPLMREPRSAPDLRAARYSEDDFKL